MLENKYIIGKVDEDTEMYAGTPRNWTISISSNLKILKNSTELKFQLTISEFMFPHQLNHVYIKFYFHITDIQIQSF